VAGFALDSKEQGEPSGTYWLRPGPGGRYLGLLSLGAVGVVYGDLGTSPLYALRECFHGEHGIPATPANVLGVLSLVFWSLAFVISLKYLGFVMRAGNRGEGGILALMSLLTPPEGNRRGGRWALVLMGLFGAALLYGDGMITPAISVLSAVEGLAIATPVFSHFVEPLTVLILVALFLFQSRGTGGIGAVFGPVMTVWFLTIAALGAWRMFQEPAILAAVNPMHAVSFFVENRGRGFLVLGAVFLVMTGGEVLYADMGHFGTRPIRLVWFTFVLPALLLNYFGQGALLLRDPSAVVNPFYRLGPPWALYPMVAIATAATVIASQAVISGAFSLTRQAVQLGYSPRLKIDHTSAREIGQIYVPTVNWILMLASIGLVLGFKSSSNLAAAYGLAVTTTMAITTVLLVVVARELWKWNPWKAGLLSLFLVADISFLGANLLKVVHGGWFPLLIGIGVLTLMTTWRRGREILSRRLAQDTLPIELFQPDTGQHPPVRVPGTAVFLSRSADGVPPALLHNLKHNHVLHERVIFLTVLTEGVPHVSARERVEVSPLGSGMYRVVLHFGFMEDPSIPAALARVKAPGLEVDEARTTYFLGHETIFASPRPGMAMWRESLFAFMSRNARSASLFFGLPPGRVVELGSQIEI
jgi:KUP system potassium uptake protein